MHLELPPHGSSRQCNGLSTIYYMRISLACWISDTLQQNTNCLFFFTAVLPSILSIHSPSAWRRFTYFTSIDMVEETLLTCRFALLIGIQHKWELSTSVCPTVRRPEPAVGTNNCLRGPYFRADLVTHRTAKSSFLGRGRKREDLIFRLYHPWKRRVSRERTLREVLLSLMEQLEQIRFIVGKRELILPLLPAGREARVFVSGSESML